jgi:hypothetical protein
VNAVAKALGRNAIGVDLSRDYLRLTDGMADALLIAEYGRRLHTGRVAA